ncbi:MAG: response regulator [Phycisphaerales bacterium]
MPPSTRAAEALSVRSRLRPALQTAPTTEHPWRLLVVEDDPGLLEAMTIRLRHAGYEVLPALDGGRAMELLRREKIHALVLDVDVPVADGFSVLEASRRPGRPVRPVIIVTGQDSEAIERHAAYRGVRAVLHKPVDASRLLTELARALDAPPDHDRRTPSVELWS